MSNQVPLAFCTLTAVNSLILLLAVKTLAPSPRVLSLWAVGCALGGIVLLALIDAVEARQARRCGRDPEVTLAWPERSRSDPPAGLLRPPSGRFWRWRRA